MADRQKLLEFYYSLQITSRQVETDILYSLDSSVEYALDYSAFYDGLTRRSRPRDALDAVSGQLYSELIAAKELPFAPFIFGATFLEVVDGFLRNIEHNKTFSMPDVAARINAGHARIQSIRAQPDPGNGHNLDIKQEYIDRELVEIERLVGKNVEERLKNLAC